jgi:SAM-dependent methyltransferase
MLELVGWNRHVLELGAAAGHMTRALVDQHCRLTSIERDAEAALQLSDVADEVIVGDLNDPSIFDKLQPEYDVVLAGDVLEHLIAPQEVLNRVTHLLKPGGHTVVSIPNVAHGDLRLALMLGTWKYRPWGLMDESRLRFFTYQTVQDMIRNAGLVITQMRRVRVPVFESELAVERSAIPTEVLDLILADPEAETYQFVLAAVVDNGDYQLRALSDRILELERSRQLLQITNDALRAQQDPLRQIADLNPPPGQVDGLNREISRLKAEIEALHQQLEDAEVARRQSSDQIDALERTKTFRYTRAAREFYGRLSRHR